MLIFFIIYFLTVVLSWYLEYKIIACDAKEQNISKIDEFFRVHVSNFFITLFISVLPVFNLGLILYDIGVIFNNKLAGINTVGDLYNRLKKDK